MSKSKSAFAAKALYESDEQLRKDIPKADWEKYTAVATDASVKKAAAALQTKGHGVTVVDTPKEALKAVKKLIPEGATVMNASAVTYEEIGLVDYLKEGKHGWKNLHADVLAEADQAKAAELRRQSMSADYWLSSVSAVSEDGDLVLADLTGTRVGGFFTAKNVVVVVGAQKIVPTYSDAAKRTKKFTLAVESARVRIVFKAPASNVSNFVALRSGNPYAPNRIQVIIVKDFLGY